jgi:hypothetical protein
MQSSFVNIYLFQEYTITLKDFITVFKNIIIKYTLTGHNRSG